MAGYKNTFTETTEDNVPTQTAPTLQTTVGYNTVPTTTQIPTTTTTTPQQTDKYSKVSDFLTQQIQNNKPNNLDNIYTTDFTKSLTEQDYLPSQYASPVKLDSIAGSYMSQIPVITGGQLLYPQKLADARRSALMEAAANKKAENQNAMQKIALMFPRLQAKEVYQNRLNDEYQQGILLGLGQVLDSYSPTEAVDILTNPTNPITAKLFANYQQYEALTNATMLGDKAVENAKTRTNAGEVFTDAETAMLLNYNNGNATNEELLQMSNFLPSYETLGKVASDDAIKNKISGTINTYLQKGLTDKNGNKISTTNGTDIATIKERLSTDPQLLADITTLFMQSGHLTPDVLKSDENGNTPLSMYVSSIVPNMVDESFQHIYSPSGDGSGSGTTKKKLLPIGQTTFYAGTNQSVAYDSNGNIIQKPSKQQKYNFQNSWSLSDIEGFKNGQILTTPPVNTIFDLDTGQFATPQTFGGTIPPSTQVSPVQVITTLQTEDGKSLIDNTNDNLKLYTDAVAKLPQSDDPNRPVSMMVNGKKTNVVKGGYVQVEYTDNDKKVHHFLYPLDTQWSNIFQDNNIEF